jgi:hypothetical protein
MSPLPSGSNNKQNIRMASPGMLRRAALIMTGVSEELRASFNRAILVTQMEGQRSTQTPVLTRATRRNIPEDAILHSHRRKNLKSYTALTGWAL